MAFLKLGYLSLEFKLHQAISNAYLPTTLPHVRYRPQKLSCPDHAAYYSPTLQHTCVRQPKCKCPFRASCRGGSLHRNSSRLSICTLPCRASGCSATIPCTDAHPTKHTYRNRLFYYPSSYQHKNCRPSIRISPVHSFYLTCIHLHTYSRPPTSKLPSRAGNHRATPHRT